MNEAEAERQFLADLEKAKALSMESQALEEFRLKKYGRNNNNDHQITSGNTRPQPKHGKTPSRNDMSQARTTRSSSVHDIKARPRPSTITASGVIPETAKLPPPRQLSMGAIGATRTTPVVAHSINEDLISWNAPSNPKCDAMKSAVQELYKVSHQSTPVHHHPPPGPFTPMGNFSFVTDPSGFLAPPVTPVDRNAPAYPHSRTVFPTLGKLNRLEYNISTPVNHFNTAGGKFGTPFSGGSGSGNSFNYSPSSLESFTPNGQFSGGMVKSQSLTAFPQQPSANTPGSGIPRPVTNNNHLSVSAHTSPVHQITQHLQLTDRVSNPSYSIVTLPRQGRPEHSRHQPPFQILPDKTKLDGAKQAQVKPPPRSISTTNNHRRTTIHSKPSDQSLIDFSEDIRKSKTEMRCITKVSVLEAFDPLLLSDEEEIPQETGGEMPESKKEAIYYSSNISEGSFYESYDPFEYMGAKAQQQKDGEDQQDAHLALQTEDLNISDGSSFLMSPRHKKNKLILSSSAGIADKATVERRKKEKAKYYERTEVIMGKCLLHRETDASKVDPEVRAFVAMVSSLRSKFRHSSSQNMGIILSPKIKTVYPIGTSVKLVVRQTGSNVEDSNNLPVIKFTCDVTSTISHILWKVIMDLEEKGQQVNKGEEFIFGICGAAEYIPCDDESKLDDYDYVHRCYKFDKDVDLRLIPLAQLKRPLLRTADDDKNDTVVRAQDISPLDSVKTLSYDELKILMETLEKESTRMSTNASHLSGCTDKAVMTALRPKQVIQAVKMVCALLGKVETIEVTEMNEKLISQCLDFDKARGNEDPSGKLRPEIVEEVGEKYATIVLSSSGKLQQQNHAKLIQDTLVRLKEVVQKLVEIYTKTFRVNFSFASFSTTSSKNDAEEFKPKFSHDILETLLIRVCALHRLQPDWKFEEYMVTLDIYHGTRPVTVTLESPWKAKTESFYERVVFDAWLETFRICSLPREARLVLNVFGRKTVIVEKQTRVIETDIGWAALQLFSFERLLAQGSFLLPLWPSAETEKKVGPAPDCGSHPFADSCPLISIELPELSSQVVFPEEVPIQLPPRLDYNFKDLDFETQQQLLDLCDQDIMTFTEYPAQDQEVLWEKRYYLTEIPGALPKVLLAAHSWDYACLPGLYGLIQQWKRPGPMDILQLFLPCFPDTHVRQVAIEWLKNVSNDDLGDFLPQLLEALKNETWSASPLAKLLLERALASPRVAHSLYWLLTQSLPGQSPQNSSVSEAEANNLDYSSRMKVGRYRRRLQMLMRALYIVSGSSLRNAFLKQQELIKRLHDAAIEVKQSKDGIRSTVLNNRMLQLNEHLRDDNATLIPLSPGLVACGVDPRASSYFPSNTLPLKLAFLSENNEIVPAIFKVGDDLRQDQLTIQMIRLMDKLWLREGLDLKMVTFACVPTGHRHGMVELVTEAKTLREIQVIGSGRGVTGSFKDTPITEWLVKHNPTQLEFATAVNNFTHSCAGYSIVTYILGICDRHNDNIMVKQSGHLFHIDFGKFLGDAQMFGNFRRDRTPFVLTPDMLHVINGGDKPTQKFHNFVDLCCQGFNLVRKNGTQLLNLFALMASSGIPGVTHDAVNYVQRALLPDLSSTEAAATFARFIEESLSSWFTQVNFFIHNLAMRFGDSTEDDSGADNSDGSGEKRAGRKAGELLSFIPKTYSLNSDGRIEAVQVYGIQKRYRPEKHYVFILKITRENERDGTYLFRTYKEFCELYSKLNRAFPKVGLHSLEKGLHLGRQEIREVAERRKHDIASFLDILFQLEESVSHSNLVYTFFHPLLRDQEETDIHIRKLKDPRTSKRGSAGMIQGQIKLSLEYRRDTFMVMVCHAKNLAIPDVSKEEPNSYVKVYLHPDPAKQTKRKTRVIHKNCHPSFMEMLEYRMPWDVIKNRTLQASIWNTDRFQENLFLGAVEIPLENFDLVDKNVENWYPLTNVKRLSGHQRHAMA